MTNLSDAQFKTLVIRMLTKMVEYGCKIEEKVKAMKSETTVPQGCKDGTIFTNQ